MDRRLAAQTSAVPQNPSNFTAITQAEQMFRYAGQIIAYTASGFLKDYLGLKDSEVGFAIVGTFPFSMAEPGYEIYRFLEPQFPSAVKVLDNRYVTHSESNLQVRRATEEEIQTLAERAAATGARFEDMPNYFTKRSEAELI